MPLAPSTRRRHAPLGAALALLAGLAPPGAAGPPIELAAQLESTQLAVPAAPATTSAGGDPVHLAVDVRVGEVAVSEYSPLVVILLLDVSGSMSGPNLDNTKDAALELLERLTPEDRLSILTFESGAPDLYTPAGPPDLEEARRILTALQPMGGTNMVDGMRLAMQRLGTVDLPGAVRRVFLLGDGDANLGEGDMNRVAAWARDHDAAVTTFAVGTGARADVMQEIAERSGGNFYPVLDAADITQEFGAELEDMKKNAGDQAQLVVKPSWGLEVDAVLGAEAQLEAGPGVVSLRNLVAGTTRRIHLRLRTTAFAPPAGTPGRVDVALSYLDEEADDGRQVHTHAGFRWAERTSAPVPGLRPTPQEDPQ